MPRYIFVLLIIFYSNKCFSKTGGSVTGIILDEKSSPAPFVNVILVNSSDSAIVKAVITDEAGKYFFSSLDSGSFRLMVSSVGYSKYYSASFEIKENEISFEPFILRQESFNLKEAQVSGLKPFIEHRIDKTIVNVENSIVNAGATALEILQRSPGIIIDKDGNISLNSKQGVLVMIDGKPTYLSSRDLYDLLKNTSSDQLSNIEIITNPSAKYDAAGTSGIINIRMRRRQSTGFNGQVHASYGQGVYPDYNTGFGINYGNSRINLYSGYDFGQGWYFERTTTYRKFSYDGMSSAFDESAFDKGDYTNHNFRGGLDYVISKKQSIGFSLHGNLNRGNDKTASVTEIYNDQIFSDSGYVTQNINKSKWNNITGSVNYLFNIDSAGQELSADVTLSKYSNANNFNFTTDYINHLNDFTYSETQTNQQPAEISIKSFKIDYTKPFGKSTKIETGIKSSDVISDNDVKYFDVINSVFVPDLTKTNHFKYTEIINAGYINWSGEFGKIGILAGLRAEQTIADGLQYSDNSSFHRNYLQFFPSIFFSYKQNDNHSYGASYSRRIDRPGYYELNPFRYFIDPYNYREGNPFLQPQLTNAYELSYHLMQVFNVSFKYSHTSDAMTQITKQIDSTRTTFITTENLHSYNNYGIDLNIPIDITAWWQSSNNFNLFNNHFQGPSSSGVVENEITSYQYNSTNTFKLPAKIILELNFWYNSKMLWGGTWLNQPQSSVGGGISRDFFNEHLQVKMNYNDIFHTEIIKSKIQFANVDATFHRIYDTQFVRFHLSYKFGKQSQRKHRINSAEEEQGRVQGGR